MAIVKGWMMDAAKEIAGADLEVGIGGHFRASVEADVVAIIEKHCPFKPDTAYVPIGLDKSVDFLKGDIVDLSGWINAHLKPLRDLLRESKREHGIDCFLTTGRFAPNHNRFVSSVCDCGADEWNRRVDEALK